MTPTAQDHFDLSAIEFHDVLALRYRHLFLGMPSICDGCGEEFGIIHALDCKRAGVATLRHDEVRDALGGIVALAHNNVVTEPVINGSQ